MSLSAVAMLLVERKLLNFRLTNSIGTACTRRLRVNRAHHGRVLGG